MMKKIETVEDLRKVIGYEQYLDALASAKRGNSGKLAYLLANNQQPIPPEVMTYLAEVQMGLEKLPKRVGRKPKCAALALRPDVFEIQMAELITKFKDAGNIKPVEMAIQKMAEITGLEVDAIITARKGRGPYGKGYPWKTRRV